MTPHRLLILSLTILMIFPSLTGCVRRRITVRSNPPGAQVFIDEQPIGVTPVSANVIYYGTRKIHLVKDGFEPVTELHTFRAPWYQIPPLDFFSENLWPGEIRDERELNFQLAPRQVVPIQEIYRRGEQLRQNAVSTGVTASRSDSFPPQQPAQLPAPAGLNPGFVPTAPPQGAGLGQPGGGYIGTPPQMPNPSFRPPNSAGWRPADGQPAPPSAIPAQGAAAMPAAGAGGALRTPRMLDGPATYPRQPSAAPSQVPRGPLPSGYGGI